VEVGRAGCGVGEGPPLLEGRDDVYEDCGFEVRGRRGGCEEAVADAGAAVVGDPVDWAGAGGGA
jgi:hypothetical protein